LSSLFHEGSDESPPFCVITLTPQRPDPFSAADPFDSAPHPRQHRSGQQLTLFYPWPPGTEKHALTPSYVLRRRMPRKPTATITLCISGSSSSGPPNNISCQAFLAHPECPRSTFWFRFSFLTLFITCFQFPSVPDPVALSQRLLYASASSRFLKLCLFALKPMFPTRGRQMLSIASITLFLDANTFTHNFPGGEDTLRLKAGLFPHPPCRRESSPNCSVAEGSVFAKSTPGSRCLQVLSKRGCPLHCSPPNFFPFPLFSLP